MTNDNIKYINKSSKERMVRELLEKKEDDYGHFPNNCYVVAKFIQGVLEIINKRDTYCSSYFNSTTYDCA